MIWIILLGGMVQGAFAQNLEIKGMVRDARNKEILEFANVVLQTMDSSFVAGTTTDMKGHFLLNKIKKGSYILSVSSLRRSIFPWKACPRIFLWEKYP